MGSARLNLNEALKIVGRLYIDTAPLIYYVEEHPSYIAKMDAIITWLEASSTAAVSSVITLTEILTLPLKLGNTTLEHQYRDILTNTGNLLLSPVTASIADYAAQLRARFNLRTPDALHIATALEAKCDAFLTNDAALKRVTEITILLLDELDSEA